MNTPPEPMLNEAGIILALFAGMALLAAACILSLLPPLLRLVQAKRAAEARTDAATFDERTPIYDRLCAQYDDFAEWESEVSR
jgi:hypothetical protein